MHKTARPKGFAKEKWEALEGELPSARKNRKGALVEVPRGRTKVHAPRRFQPKEREKKRGS